jgi:multiple sugar transport system substrate-binding protein
MMKKLLASLSVSSMLLVSALAGCGTGEDTKEANNNATKTEEVVEVSLAGWGGNQTEQDSSSY